MTKTCLPIILALAVTLLPANAEDWITTDGVAHKDVKIVKVGADSVTITDSNGGATIPFSALSLDLQKRFGYTPPATVDPMKVVASWTSITTALGKVIPITKVTAVDAHSVHYETANGVGSVEISDLPDDVQKSLGYDPAAAAKAIADQQARNAATDAMVAHVTAQDQAAKLQSDQTAATQSQMVKNAVYIHGKVLQKTDDGLIVDCDSDKYEAGVPGGPLKLVGQGVNATRIFGVTVMLTHYPNQETLVDGSPVSTVAYPTGPYSYTNVMGAQATIASYTATLPSGN
ncbi:MAG: hypothetical protein LV481_04595 [Methylacidiphilales bacterium]|nr:hypothetical protein [Candidatus Methylacidiphilales bacterium]